MAEDFAGRRVFLRGHETGLFQQRKVDIAFNVAGRARVAVPVPGASEIPALLDHANVLHARLAQARTGQKAAKAAADHDNIDLVAQRRTLDHLVDIRVIDIGLEVILDLDILLIAVRAQALVALCAVPRAQGLGIESHFRCV